MLPLRNNDDDDDDDDDDDGVSHLSTWPGWSGGKYVKN